MLSFCFSYIYTKKNIQLDQLRLDGEKNATFKLRDLVVYEVRLAYPADKLKKKQVYEFIRQENRFF